MAVTNTSATSVVMLRGLLEHEGLPAGSLLTMPPDSDAMLAAAPACLLIGDEALRFRPAPSLFVYDLGEWWRRATGTAAIFAVLAARRDYLGGRVFMIRDIVRRMRQNVCRVLADPGALSDIEVGVRGLDLAGYLAGLRYEYAEGDEAGVLRLASIAANHGISAPMRKVAFAWTR